MKFISQAKYKTHFKPGSAKKEKGQSNTIPGQAFSIKELAHKYEATGMVDATLYRQGQYPEEVLFDANMVDVTDYATQAKNARNILDKVNDFQKEVNASEAKQKAVEEEIKKREEAKTFQANRDKEEG